MSHCVTVCLVLVLVCLTNAFIPLELKSQTTKYGFVYPNRAELNTNGTFVMEGVDVLFYLIKVPESFICTVTSPDVEITYTLADSVDDKSSKVTYWTPNSKNTGCGAKIRNIKVSDSGRWKLKALNEETGHLYQSFINLKVIPNFDRKNGTFIVKEGVHNELHLTNLSNYCAISNPNVFHDHNIFDQCLVDLDNVNKLYDGQWKVNVGVYGKIDEVILKPSVVVLGETFDVGYNKTKSKINLYCNLKNAMNTTISFCRFMKSGSEFGFRLHEGLSNGDYSYFGWSLKDGDCGLTIENPKPEDLTVWKCTLGIYRNDIAYEIKESIISLADTSRRSLRLKENNTVDEILASVGNPLEIVHKTDFRIKYCVIKHPKGKLYPINGELRNENWTSFGNINVGECGIKMLKSSKDDDGSWYIQVGDYETHTMDEIVKINVRIVETAMAAIKENLIATVDSHLTIKCKSIADKPNILEYCRFSLPNEKDGFVIDEKVTADNPIDGLYWYNGTSIEKGDCQVTIKKVNSQHFGKWLCGGKIIGSNNIEDSAYITVEEEKLSVAAISGIAVGSASVFILTVGGIVYIRKKKRQQSQRRQTYLSTNSRSSGSDVSVYERNVPLVVAEQQPEIVVQEIEMTEFSRNQSEPSEPSPSVLTSQE